MMSATDRDLTGARILVAEDSLLVAEFLADLLESAGATVVGPFPRVTPALAAAEREGLEGALLDVNLAGEDAGPIAAALRTRDIPFIFLTGYTDADALPGGFRTAPRLAKPVATRDLAAAIAAHFRLAAKAPA